MPNSFRQGDNRGVSLSTRGEDVMERASGVVQLVSTHVVGGVRQNIPNDDLSSTLWHVLRSLERTVEVRVLLLRTVDVPWKYGNTELRRTVVSAE